MPYRYARLQVRLVPGLGQPLPTVMPVTQGTLGFLQSRHRVGGQLVQLGVSLGGIAHPLDQQAQSVAIMIRILQSVVEFLPLLGQALLDARAQALEQLLVLHLQLQNASLICLLKLYRQH